MASAMVGLAINSCQFSMGSWLVMMVDARSGPSRSAVPIDREQSFRLIPIIRSGITISLWTGANGTVG